MNELENFRKFLKEEDDLPSFSKSDIEILEFMLDNIGNLSEGDEPYDIVQNLLNSDYFTIYHDEGAEFLENIGVLRALSYVFEKENELVGEISKELGRNIADESWSSIANLYAYYRGEELLDSLETYRRLIEDDEKLTENDIAEIKDELEFLT